MTHTSTAPSGQLFNAEELYNILMGAIEPELCTDILPVLDELYLDETQEHRILRMQRYVAAIERFKERAAEFAHDFSGAIWAMSDAAMQIAKEEQGKEDASHLQAAEDSLENS